MTETTRRAMLAGAAGVGAAAALAACGTDANDGATPGTGGTTGGATTGGATTGGAPTGGAPTTGGGATNALAKTSDIPAGGGKIFPAEKVVVTQPTTGNFKAFSAVCTHAGCTVGSIDNGIIKCPCHQSMYSIADGSVKGGPAPRPLAAKTIKVEGGNISLA